MSSTPTSPATQNLTPIPALTHDHRTFVWYELRTADIPGAQRFYAGLFGWTLAEVRAGERMVQIALVGDRPYVMFIALGAHDASPRWTGSIVVPDVDAAARRVVELGGAVLEAPTDIPGHARMAVVRDPQGASFALLRPITEVGERSGVAQNGEFCWSILASPDPAAAGAFYTSLLGWTTSAIADDPTTLLMLDANKAAGIVPAPPAEPARWSMCVQVDNVAKAREQAVAAGGSAVGPEVVVPDIGTYALITDPVGATLCVLQPQWPIPPPAPAKAAAPAAPALPDAG